MSRLERIDYGTTYKYFPNPSLTLGQSRDHQPASHKQEFSLLNYNPHRHGLGLQAEDFTPAKLCAHLLSSANDADVATTAAADHQLLDSKSPAGSAAAVSAAEAEAANGTSADNAAGATATAAAAAAEPDDQHLGPAAAAIKVPDIQFVDDSDSGSESDEENSSSSSESEPGSDAVKQQHKKPQTCAADHDDQPQQQQQQQRQKGQSEDPITLCSSSSSGSESDTEGDSDDVELVEVEAAESEDNFLPLLPRYKTGDQVQGSSDMEMSDHSDHEGQNLGRSGPDRTPGYKPPWLPRLARFSSPMLRLHNEIVGFTKMLEPTSEEVDSRAKSMTVIKEVVHSIWPQAEVLVFGSYATGLYTPASDTDIVVVNAGLNNPITGLKALSHALTQQQLVRNMQQVLTARVPIIKFEMIESGLAFDVSWEQRSGPVAVKVVRSLLAQWPVMKPLVLVLKVFLTQRELNEVYGGGIGSYSLIIMVAAFLQLHASRRPKTTAAGVGSKRGRSSSSGGVPVASAIEANLGLLLLDFFRLYGRALNLSEVGVTCANDGYFYSKSSNGFIVHDRPWLLSVQDPLDPQNDTARNSWNIKMVRQVLDHAYQLLTAPCSAGESLLGRIIHLAPVVSGRPIPAWFHKAPRTPLGRSHRGDSSGRVHPRTPSGYREKNETSHRGNGKKSHRSRDRDREQSRSRSRSDIRGGSSSRKKHRAEKMVREHDRARDCRGGSSSKQRSSGNNFAAAGNSGGVSRDWDRDAAGRSGAAAGSGRSHPQQRHGRNHHQRVYQDSPSHKRSRR